MIQQLQKFRWNAWLILNQAVTRFGFFAWIFFGLLGLAAALAMALASQSKKLEALNVELQDRVARGNLVSQPVPVEKSNHIDAFREQLLPYADIPDALQGIWTMSATHNLAVKNATYRSVTDAAGGFLRYQIRFQIRGPSQDIEKFLSAILEEQKMLAIRKVQLKRERAQASEIEAIIECHLIAALPVQGATQSGAREMRSQPQ